MGFRTKVKWSQDHIECGVGLGTQSKVGLRTQSEMDLRTKVKCKDQNEMGLRTQSEMVPAESSRIGLSTKVNGTSGPWRKNPIRSGTT